jgi:hypothetical protein
MATKKKLDVKYVVVRSNMSGVWIGTLVKRDGRDVTLKDAQKIWRWRGANTTSELALQGCVPEYSRVARVVEEVTVLDCCEVIAATSVARSAVAACGWSP